MIHYVRGDLFESPAQTLVNTVNTVGVMGKGIAKRFKTIFPDMFREYQMLCENDDLNVGQLYLYNGDHKNVLNFPTKKHWRNPSQVEWIEDGLRTFLGMYERSGISSISFPPLGCGNGGLDFAEEVRPVMEKYLSDANIPVFIHLYDKNESPPEHKKPEETERWLRSRPQDLAFTEVWRDIKEIIRTREVFRTLQKNNPYTAQVARKGDSDIKGIRIRAHNHTRFVESDEVQSFWQQLRSVGVISSKHTPSRLERDWSYLAPILSHLEYISTEKISDNYGNLINNPRVGLKYVKPNNEKGSNVKVDNKTGQMNMFGEDNLINAQHGI